MNKFTTFVLAAMPSAPACRFVELAGLPACQACGVGIPPYSPADRFYLEVGGGKFIEIFKNDSEPAARLPLRHFCIETDDLDDVIRRLRDGGFAPAEKNSAATGRGNAGSKVPRAFASSIQEYTLESSQRTGTACTVTWT